MQMKAFRLEPVLNFRQRKETLLQQRHAVEAQRYQEALNALQELFAEQDRVTAMLADIMKSTALDLEALDHAHRYLDLLALAVRKQKAIIADRERDVAEAHGALVEASQERQAIERLKEKHIDTQ